MKTNEQVMMNTDRLDDESVVVNFNVYDHEHEEVVKDGGYVCIRQELDFFNVVVFDCNGDVLSEVNVPFKFKGVDE